MAILANGVNLQHLRYEFGVKDANGDVYEADNYDDAWAWWRAQGGTLVMRALYSTSWEEAVHDHN